MNLPELPAINHQGLHLTSLLHLHLTVPAINLQAFHHYHLIPVRCQVAAHLRYHPLLHLEMVKSRNLSRRKSILVVVHTPLKVLLQHLHSHLHLHSQVLRQLFRQVLHLLLRLVGLKMIKNPKKQVKLRVQSSLLLHPVRVQVL